MAGTSYDFPMVGTMKQQTVVEPVFLYINLNLGGPSLAEVLSMVKHLRINAATGAISLYYPRHDDNA